MAWVRSISYVIGCRKENNLTNTKQNSMYNEPILLDGKNKAYLKMPQIGHLYFDFSVEQTSQFPAISASLKVGEIQE
jgi:hypothetical protein